MGFSNIAIRSVGFEDVAASSALCLASEKVAWTRWTGHLKLVPRILACSLGLVKNSRR